MSAPVVVVLASGRGSRFLASGGQTHKLQALLAKKTVLQHTLDAVVQSGLEWHLEKGDHAGMGDSIAAAVRATSHHNGWLILPGDLPLIQSETLLAVAVALRSHQVVVPRYCGRRGHPVGFGKNCLQALLDLHGAAGARDIVQSHPSLLLDVPDQGVVMDIDHLADLHEAERALLGEQNTPARS